MEMTSEKVGDVTVLTPLGEYVDASNGRAFGRQVTGAVAPGSRLVLDMGRLAFIDSAGCGALITILRHVRSGGGDLKLCAVTKSVRMILELVRFHGLVDIFNTRDEALRAFQL